MTIEIRRFNDLAGLSRFAAEMIHQEATAAAALDKKFSMALSGGRTPRTLYNLLAEEPFGPSLPWGSVHLFWSDERCLPPDSPDSNVGLAREVLISGINIPAENVHQPRLSDHDCAVAAAEYEAELARFFRPEPGAWPVFDLILLGLGMDGHTASLFPGDAALNDNERWVTRVDGKTASPPMPRLTLTLPVINSARTVVFLVSGDEKLGVVEAILGRAEAATRYPAAMVRPTGRLVWLLNAG
ncbi:MAG: 6-phosphogluconolactonase [Proteobacteria bacterium]|nr:6-phosphogluconolactonase [Pseudomonadota bacterium]MBU1741069.1 6-phosphogluconolactonase [Pseudomonadota bacterium]